MIRSLPVDRALPLCCNDTLVTITCCVQVAKPRNLEGSSKNGSSLLENNLFLCQMYPNVKETKQKEETSE